MRSGLIESWSANPAETGPMYPLVGYEISMLALCLILWGLYTLWQLRRESKQYREEIESLSEDYKLIRILQRQRKKTQELS